MMVPGGNSNDDDDDHGLLADINVTPFIDVMLVLLTIFMVTAPMLASGMKVDLPAAASATPVKEQKPVIVAIAADGVISVGKTPVAIADLVTTIQHDLAGEDRLIQVRADRATVYGNVAGVLDALSAGGLTKFVLAFERPKPQP
jgi:biopolymer transport protein ExbD